MKLFHWIDRFFGHRWVRREEFDFYHPYLRQMIAHQCAWCGTIMLKKEGNGDGLGPYQLLQSPAGYAKMVTERNATIAQGLARVAKGE
jgi:hypothetical protein